MFISRIAGLLTGIVLIAAIMLIPQHDKIATWFSNNNSDSTLQKPVGLIADEAKIKTSDKSPVKNSVEHYSEQHTDIGVVDPGDIEKRDNPIVVDNNKDAEESKPEPEDMLTPDVYKPVISASQIPEDVSVADSANTKENLHKLPVLSEEKTKPRRETAETSKGDELKEETLIAQDSDLPSTEIIVQDIVEEADIPSAERQYTKRQYIGKAFNTSSKAKGFAQYLNSLCDVACMVEDQPKGYQVYFFYNEASKRDQAIECMESKTGIRLVE